MDDNDPWGDWLVELQLKHDLLAERVIALEAKIAAIAKALERE